MIFKLVKLPLKYIKKYRFVRKHLKVGKNTKILTSFKNFGSEPYLIEIGDNCLITRDVKFVNHDGSICVPLDFYENIKLVDSYSRYNLFGKVKIGDNCFIGIGSIILPGVNIGSNSIIGAGSVVTKDVPAEVVVAGNPAKIICSIESYYLSRKEKIIEIRNAIDDKDFRTEEICKQFLNGETPR